MRACWVCGTAVQVSGDLALFLHTGAHSYAVTCQNNPRANAAVSLT